MGNSRVDSGRKHADSIQCLLAARTWGGPHLTAWVTHIISSCMVPDQRPATMLPYQRSVALQANPGELFHIGHGLRLETTLTLHAPQPLLQSRHVDKQYRYSGTTPQPSGAPSIFHPSPSDVHLTAWVPELSRQRPRRQHRTRTHLPVLPAGALRRLTMTVTIPPTWTQPAGCLATDDLYGYRNPKGNFADILGAPAETDSCYPSGFQATTPSIMYATGCPDVGLALRCCFRVIMPTSKADM